MDAVGECTTQTPKQNSSKSYLIPSGSEAMLALEPLLLGRGK